MNIEAIPALKGPVAGLGDIMQLAFVPRDMEAALRFWTQVMGAGPFFRRSRLRFPSMKFRGQPTDAEFSVLIGYWGDIQIELIEQHNDAPSAYREFLAAGGEGMHHVCIIIDDIAAARARCLALGMEIAQELEWPGGGALYVDTGGGPGTMVEMITLAPGMGERFARFRAAARDWDGREPLREA